jgi:hypothetical protein
MTLNVYASLFEDDLDDVSNRLDAALLAASAACMRPEPSGSDPRTAVADCPNISFPRTNASAPPAGFEPATQGLGNLCSIP